MGKGPRYRMNLKRRREGKTDYRQRLRLLKSGKPRAVVRLTNKHVYVQFIEYNPEGDQVRTEADSIELEDYGWEGHGCNLPSAYLVGFLGGKKALENDIKDAVLDIGLGNPHPGGRYFSALNGIVDAGVDVPHDPKILPDEERLKGQHIDEKTVEEFEDVKSKLEEL